MNTIAKTFALLNCIVLVACASTAPKKAVAKKTPAGDGRFPSAQALQALEDDNAELPAQELYDPNTFDLVGELPDRYGNTPADVTTPFGRLVQAALPNVKRSKEMDCVARQVGHFMMEFKNKVPGLTTKAFIQSRCGAEVIDFGLSFLGGTTDEYNDDLLIGTRSVELEKMTKAFGQNLREDLGITMVRNNNRVIFVLAGGLRAVRFDAPIEQVSKVALLTGSVGKNVEEIFALATKGRYETQACTTVTEGSRFRFECPLSEDDALVRVDIGVREKGAVLGRKVAGLLFRPKGDEVRRFNLSRYSPERKAKSEDALHAAFFEDLNVIRQNAGLEPLVEDVAQQKVVQKLVRPFFSALLTNDAGALDQITLGVMAGWSVQGAVRQGGVGLGYLSPSYDVSRLLAQILDGPTGRSVLLNPRVSKNAIGVIVENKAIAVLAGVYEVVNTTEYEARSNDAFSQLEQAFAKKDMPAPLPFDAAKEPLLDLVRSVEKGEISYADSLKLLTDKTVQKSVRGVRTQVFSVADPEAIEFPDDLLVPGIELALALCHLPPKEGDPWRQYVMYVVVHSQNESQALLGER